MFEPALALPLAAKGRGDATCLAERPERVRRSADRWIAPSEPYQMSTPERFECIVIGGGPAGLAAASALAAKGLRVALAAAAPVPAASAPAASDTRTAALFPSAIALLDNLGAWRALREACSPITGIRLVDDTGNLLRAPEVIFAAHDIGLADLGYNVPNAALAASLAAAAGRLGVLMLEDGRALGIDLSGPEATIELSGGRMVAAPLLVAADGRASVTREAAGIGVRRNPLEQMALACSFRHSRPHGGISTELHGPAGPCTTVPLPGNASSLVWMHRPDEIARLERMPAPEFLDRLAERLGGLLGAISDPTPRRAFDLVSLVPETMGRKRVALLGEAAHALPPIGAQGLNLGLVDAAVLADLVAQARARGDDIGAPALLATYSGARLTEVERRIGAVDLLNRSLWPGLWPLGLARGAGLHVLAAMPSLRRRLMREGLYPPAPIPSLMQAGLAPARPAPTTT